MSDTLGYSVVTEIDGTDREYPNATVDQFHSGVITVTDIATGATVKTYWRGEWLRAAKFDADDCCEFGWQAGKRRGYRGDLW